MASTRESTERQSRAAPRPTRRPGRRSARTRIEYQRFNVFHRWMHFLVFVSFTVLVFTGMPLKYKDTRVGAVVHGPLRRRHGGRRLPPHRRHRHGLLLDRRDDLHDHHGHAQPRQGRHAVPGSSCSTRRTCRTSSACSRWFFGTGAKPQFDRYTYWEKFDYLSLVAGTVIIGATGFMMWFPLETTKYLPGIFLNVALVIHSNEALLAMGVIFIFVHFFSAHLKPESFPLDKVIFTGSLPVEHYKEERPLEYARRVREGTLDEVLVEKRITWKTHVADVIWWIITAFAGVLGAAHDGVHHLVGLRLRPPATRTGRQRRPGGEDGEGMHVG